jgi:DNA-binding XRE family transcriptional regulator
MASECGEHWMFHGEASGDTLHYKEEIIRTAEFILPDGVEESEVISVYTDRSNGKPILETKYDVWEDIQEYTDRARIGARIAALRQARGMTQAQLAEACGMKAPNIARIETGRYSTGLDILAKIANALDCTLDFIEK